MKKNILVLASTFPTSENDTQPEFIKKLCQELSEHAEITVLLPSAPNTCSRETINNIKIIRFRYFLKKWETLSYGSGILSNLKANKWKWLLVPFFLIAQQLAVIKLIVIGKFDLVHAHWIIPQGLVAAISKTIIKTPPIVITAHGADLFALKHPILKKIKSWILNNADDITVVSKSMKNYCTSQLNISKKKISVLSMGVDLTKRFVLADNNLRTRNKLILVEKKGVTFLIQALPNILIAHPDTTLKIIGDGPFRASLEDEVRRLKLQNNVSFLGAVINKDIPQHLQTSSIALVPSIIGEDGDQEGLGLVAVEAMGCGCAVVASDLPALHDVIIDQETGLFTIPTSPQSISEKVIQLLSDETLRKTLANQGNKYVFSKFEWSSIGSSYWTLLTKMIERSK
jgi:glycosyltransferase involved in cell wall biosynthesis